MKLPRRKFLHFAAGAAALPAVSRVARAQAYPTRPDGCHRSRRGRAHAGAARPTDHHGKCDGRGRQPWRRQFRAKITRSASSMLEG